MTTRRRQIGYAAAALRVAQDRGYRGRTAAWGRRHARRLRLWRGLGVVVCGDRAVPQGGCGRRRQALISILNRTISRGVPLDETASPARGERSRGRPDAASAPAPDNTIDRQPPASGDAQGETSLTTSRVSLAIHSSS